ncbi:hypothetical protein BHM03_00050353 [Ensete ventricosum]|nr:hypothetical protein BHM03_00050353 [Ensete ventricosum]
MTRSNVTSTHKTLEAKHKGVEQVGTVPASRTRGRVGGAGSTRRQCGTRSPILSPPSRSIPFSSCTKSEAGTRINRDKALLETPSRHSPFIDERFDQMWRFFVNWEKIFAARVSISIRVETIRTPLGIMKPFGRRKRGGRGGGKEAATGWLLIYVKGSPRALPPHRPSKPSKRPSSPYPRYVVIGETYGGAQRNRRPRTKPGPRLVREFGGTKSTNRTIYLPILFAPEQRIAKSTTQWLPRHQCRGDARVEMEPTVILRCGFDTIARSVGERHRLAYACKGEKSNATGCFPRKSETERVAFWDVALFRKSTHDVSVWGPKLSLYTRRAHTPIAGDRNRDWSRATKPSS